MLIRKFLISYRLSKRQFICMEAGWCKSEMFGLTLVLYCYLHFELSFSYLVDNRKFWSRLNPLTPNVAIQTQL